MKEVHSFLGHAVFYQRFILDFSKISNLLYKLFENKTKLFFKDDCIKEFEFLKRKIVEALIIVASDRSKSFEIICDVRGVALGAMLDKIRTNYFI